jgi:hypothetical protein
VIKGQDHSDLKKEQNFDIYSLFFYVQSVSFDTFARELHLVGLEIPLNH